MRDSKPHWRRYAGSGPALGNSALKNAIISIASKVWKTMLMNWRHSRQYCARWNKSMLPSCSAYRRRAESRGASAGPSPVTSRWARPTNHVLPAKTDPVAALTLSTGVPAGPPARFGHNKRNDRNWRAASVCFDRSKRAKACFGFGPKHAFEPTIASRRKLRGGPTPAELGRSEPVRSLRGNSRAWLRSCLSKKAPFMNQAPFVNLNQSGAPHQSSCLHRAQLSREWLRRDCEYSI